MSKKIAFIFKTDEARRKYLSGMRELFGQILTVANLDKVVTLSGETGYLMLEDELEARMCGRTINEYYFMEGDPGPNVDINILKAAVIASKG